MLFTNKRKNLTFPLICATIYMKKKKTQNFQVG